VGILAYYYNEVGVILLRASELRKGKSEDELSQSEAMKRVWKELREY